MFFKANILLRNDLFYKTFVAIVGRAYRLLFVFYKNATILLALQN